MLGRTARLSWIVFAAAAASCIPKDQVVSAETGTPGASAPPPSGGNLLKASTFDDGKSLPWMTSFTTPGAGNAKVSAGAYCLDVQNRGKNPWDAQVRHREMTIRSGHTYSVQFKASATRPTKIRPKIGMAGPPYREYWSQTIEIDTSPRLYTGTFTMHGDDDPTAEFAFHVGGSLAASEGEFTICLDDVYLTDPEYTPGRAVADRPVSAVRVNQVGYLPSFPKRAVLESASADPVAFDVLDEAGKVVQSGKTRPFGKDADSGDSVHWVDFSELKTPHEGYRVRVGEDTSHPFAVGGDVYATLKKDALAYFYHNRSGIPIEMPYAGKKEWTRPAGHPGDKKIACAPGSGCNYSLDVSGGWYDAGDHGKYVVNGGISVWTLLDLYERTRFLGSSIADFGDGKLDVPERGNRVPDLLDEARWELEFLLKMQVPEGQPLAGMAHHKIHDDEWTALATRPEEAEKKVARHLHAPTTAATLNLAATAAQGARVFKEFDAAFSKRCLTAAERAWAAAKKNPKIFASPKDETGGGPYDDDDVSDELAWAAAELFVTTGKAEYKDAVLASPGWKAQRIGTMTDLDSGMTWRDTAALGVISLAVVPGHHDKKMQADARAKIIGAADAYRGFIDRQGYRVPVNPAASKYPWGSNSFILNNMIVLALAHDFTKKPEYAHAVAEGMDYILGKNPLAQSYVTGYGEYALENPHHRFWARQANPDFPAAPPGAVSGGPNSSIQDPYAQAAGLSGCAPQTCFIDHIESWSTNEITINWNSPLAWVAAFLDEKGR